MTTRLRSPIFIIFFRFIRQLFAVLCSFPTTVSTRIRKKVRQTNNWIRRRTKFYINLVLITLGNSYWWIDILTHSWYDATPLCDQNLHNTLLEVKIIIWKSVMRANSHLYWWVAYICISHESIFTTFLLNYYQMTSKNVKLKIYRRCLDLNCY